MITPNFWRAYLGTSLEALVTSSSARSGAGETVHARRSLTVVLHPTTDPVVGSGSTDASGFVAVPIRNGTVSGSDIYVYLTG